MLPFDLKENMNAYCASVILGKDMYFQSYDKYLMRLNLNTHKTEVITEIINFQYLRMVLAQYMCLLDKKIYFFDSVFHKIASYHLETKVCNIEVNTDITNPAGVQYLAVEKYNDVIYAFPRGIDKVIKIASTVSEKQYDAYSKMDRTTATAFRRKEKIFFYASNSDELLVFDMEEEKFFVQKIQSMKGKRFDIFLHKNKLFILNSNGVISIWDNNGNRLIDTAHVGNLQELDYARIVVTEKRIWILPGRGEDIYVSDNNMKFYRYDNYPSDICFRFNEETMKVRWKFFEYCEDANYYYFAARTLSQILRIHKKTGEEKWIAYALSNFKEKIKYCIKEGEVITEQKQYLNEFIKILTDF